MKQYINSNLDNIGWLVFTICISLFALMLFAGAVGAQEGITVDMQTGPDAYAKGSGKVALRTPTEQEVGRALAYPGVGADNFRARVAQWARCQNPGASEYRGRPLEYAGLDVSGVRQYLSVRDARVLRSDGASEKQLGGTQVCDASQSESSLTCSVNLHRTVTNSVTRSAQNTYSGTASITVGMRFGGSAAPVGGSVEAGFSFTAGYAETNGWSSTDSVGWDLGATTTAPAGKVRQLKVVAKEEQATFRIDYQTSIEGLVRMQCYEDTPWKSVTVAELYDGSLVPLPGGRTYEVQRMPTSDLDYTENITLSLYFDAQVIQTDG